MSSTRFKPAIAADDAAVKRWDGAWRTYHDRCVI
jgi:hypothetical protein